MNDECDNLSKMIMEVNARLKAEFRNGLQKTDRKVLESEIRINDVEKYVKGLAMQTEIVYIREQLSKCVS